MSDERTERATPRRRQKAQQEGDRVSSRELTSACGMLAGVLCLGHIAQHWASMWPGLVTQFLAVGISRSAWQDDQAGNTLLVLRHVVMVGLSPLLLLFACAVSASLFVAVAQNKGIQFHAQSLQPKFSRLNPASNIKNIFSMQGVSRLAKSFVPVAVLAAFMAGRLKQQATIPPMSAEHLPVMFLSVYDLLLDTAWILFAWSAVDYIVQWRSWESRLRMSKQEMRDERKESEGSPQTRSRIRGLQRQMRRKKLKADVRRATVVITNPTHYAVALSFDFETMEPPRVLAKGRDLLAAQIKEEARWASVPIVENPPLARSLYRSVEAGQSIPVDLYAAVAAILAYLYRQQVAEKARRDAERKKQAAKQTMSEAPPVMRASALSIAQQPETPDSASHETQPDTKENA